MLIMFFLMIMVLICITFLTLLEQKLLSYIQIRKGPNVVGLMGFFQPFSDALKLFSKEITQPAYSNFLIYYFSPIFSLTLSLIIWLMFPFIFNCFSFNFLFLFSLLSVGVYFIMISGWSSNSNFSLLGCLRSIAQTVSYEIVMTLVFMCFIIYPMSFNILTLMNIQKNFSMVFLNLPLVLILFVIFLAETNRAPFDFAEGESELVSGFNTEYSSGGFSLIFLAEYSMILFFSMIFSIMFLYSSVFYFLFYLKFMFLSFLFIWVRGSFPRFRYDKLMSLTWKFFLIISLNLFIFSFMFKTFLFIFL